MPSGIAIPPGFVMWKSVPSEQTNGWHRRWSSRSQQEQKLHSRRRSDTPSQLHPTRHAGSTNCFAELSAFVSGSRCSKKAGHSPFSKVLCIPSMALALRFHWPIHTQRLQTFPTVIFRADKMRVIGVVEMIWIHGFETPDLIAGSSIQ